jgi:hypothetical protein
MAPTMRGAVLRGADLLGGGEVQVDEVVEQGGALVGGARAMR